MQYDKRENPAKTFLKRYRAMIQRRDSLQRSIDGAYSRAMSCTAKPKAVNVQGSPAAYDRMAEDVVTALDSTEQLRRVIADINRELADIVTAIENVPDELQKTVLTLRYIEGMPWEQINAQLHIERSWGTKLHGRGLWHVKAWMAEHGRLTDN